ncbi:MAG: hypothetical protein PHD19_13220 [Dechloromonas sp.]|nr:hypothetical protein [Dechloromonas sp.]
MKPRPAPRPMAPGGPAGPEPSADFWRGFVASGLLAAVQERHGKPRLDRRALRRALQGGCALATGTQAAHAWRWRDAPRVAACIGLGLLAVTTLEHVLRENAAKEISDEQEEA